MEIMCTATAVPGVRIPISPPQGKFRKKRDLSFFYIKHILILAANNAPLYLMKGETVRF